MTKEVRREGTEMCLSAQPSSVSMTLLLASDNSFFDAEAIT